MEQSARQVVVVHHRLLPMIVREMIAIKATFSLGWRVSKVSVCMCVRMCVRICVYVYVCVYVCVQGV